MSSDKSSTEMSEEQKKAEDDAKTTRFMNALTGVTLGVKGILRRHTRKTGIHKSRPNRPHKHQRQVVKRMIGVKTGKIIINHSAGLGKTFSFLLYVAAKYTLDRGKMPKVLITAPTSCLKQWHDAILDTLRINPDRVLRTTKRTDMSDHNIESHDIIITSRDMIGAAARESFVWVTQHHQNERGNWISAWDRKHGVPLHPIFATTFDIVGFDEVHALRNPLTTWTHGHNVIAEKAAFTVGISASLIYNKPDDLRGIAVGLAMNPDYREKNWWFHDRKCTRLKTEAIKEFGKNLDTVGEEVLNLPPIVHYTKSFNADIPVEEVAEYNSILAAARKLRVYMQRNGRASNKDHLALLGHLQRMQQFLVSPVIAKHGASDVSKSNGLIRGASEVHTGALKALKAEVESLNAEGFNRIMVASMHTTLLNVARAYMTRESPGCGDIFVYDGSLSQKRRSEIPQSFLNADHSILFLSIEAGGTGLHLCPGCQAIIFFGSRPFSPMQVMQTSKRIHRIGQDKPCRIVHLIASGSVDYAINRVHADKQVLADSIYDSSALEAKNGRWRTTGRIVDSCAFVNEAGQFEASITEDEIQQRYAPPPDHQNPTGAQPDADPAPYQPQYHLVPQFQLPGIQGLAAQLLANAAQAAQNLVVGL